MHCIRKLSLHGCLPNIAALVKIPLAIVLIIQPSQMTSNQTETTLSKPDCTDLVRFFRAVALALSVSSLGACASITSLLGNITTQDVVQVEPREFITAADLAQIKPGMSRAQVKSRLGPPTLNETEQDDQ
jgi:SmpA / OmlA family